MSIVDLDTLRHLYVDEQLSIRDVAASLGIDPRTVHTALIRARIARRQRWEHHNTAMERAAHGQLNEARLRQLYLIEQLSIREIAIILDTCTATVHHALVAWNIQRRKRGRREKSTLQFASVGSYAVGDQVPVDSVDHTLEM